MSLYLKRYTTLSSAIDALKNGRITMLDPRHWDDRNDSYFLDIYRKHKKAQKLFALCCTRASETYHHWRIFTPATEGICLEIKRLPFVRSLSAYSRVRYRNVSYKLLKDLKNLDSGDFDSLPFIKRRGYLAEEEWRAIVTSTDVDEGSFSLNLDPRWINRVVVNPWMALPLYETIKQTVSEIPGCKGLRVTRSSLIDSAAWKAAGDELKTKFDNG